MLVDDSTPPRPLAPGPGVTVEQYVVFESETVKAFSELSGDIARLHLDADFAAARNYEGCIVHGFLVAARFSRLLGMFLPGEDSVIQSVQLNYRRPVLIGQPVKYSVSVSKVIDAVGAVTLDLDVLNGEKALVTGAAQCVMRPTSTP